MTPRVYYNFGDDSGNVIPDDGYLFGTCLHKKAVFRSNNITAITG